MIKHHVLAAIGRRALAAAFVLALAVVPSLAVDADAPPLDTVAP